MKFTLAIGNPPYGVGGNLAIRFLNKTSEITSIRKPSSQNRIKPYLHCMVDEDLDSTTFPGGISAVKQYWQSKNTSRFDVGVGEIPMHTEHPDFEFLSYEERFEADVFVGEYGCGPSGRVKTEDFTKYAKGHHFLSVRSPEVIENLVDFADKFREAATQTNGRYHFGKNDLISTYNKCLEERNAV